MKLFLVASVIAFFGAVLAEDPYMKENMYKAPPMPYYFSYGIMDDYVGTNFNQNEKSDGNLVKGSYEVQLPDGRKQIVDYEADHERGFVAKVSYKGEAKYPSYGAEAITFAPDKGYAPDHRQSNQGGYH